MRVFFLTTALVYFLVQPHRIEQEKPPQNNNQNAENKTAPSQNSSIATTSPGKETKTTTEKDDKGRANPSYWEKVISPDILPNWILMAVGIIGAVIAVITLILIYCQSQDTQRALHWAKKSAIAAKYSADASLQIVKATINAERARIEIDLVEATTHVDHQTGEEIMGVDLHDYGRYGIGIINYGKTAARVICFKIFSDCSANRIDPYKMTNGGLYPNHMLLGTDKSFVLHNFDFPNLFSQKDWSDIQDCIKYGIVRIDVSYDDIVRGDTPEAIPEPHRTSAVFVWDHVNEEAKRLLQHNEYT